MTGAFLRGLLVCLPQHVGRFVNWLVYLVVYGETSSQTVRRNRELGELADKLDSAGFRTEASRLRAMVEHRVRSPCGQ